MNVYDALAEPVRSWIDARGWNDFMEIQAAAIPHILAGSGALLVSSTAFGKTEAAVVPIVSTILADRLPPVAFFTSRRSRR
jgi:ATP-dependent Lhr-like helicase